MAWYVATFRETAEGGRTISHVYDPDGKRLAEVPRDERGKPLDTAQRARLRMPGIVWRRRAKAARNGEDHYWVMGSGDRYLIVIEDVTNSGQVAYRIEQRPKHPTLKQVQVLEKLGLSLGLERVDASTHH